MSQPISVQDISVRKRAKMIQKYNSDDNNDNNDN